MAVVSCYVDVPGFVAGAMGVETASLLGGNSTIASAVAQGATSLTVASGTGFAAGPGWVLDGPNSEAISITSVSGATLTLGTGLQAAHAAGVCVATPGAAGSLADVLVGPRHGWKAIAGKGDRVTRAIPCSLRRAAANAIGCRGRMRCWIRRGC